MNLLNLNERDRLHQQLGERDERVRQLEWQVAKQKELWETDAQEWQRLLRHRRDLAEWLVDAVTDSDGRFVKQPINAALGGEAFVPCTITTTVHGKRYQLSLVSTCYEVEVI